MWREESGFLEMFLAYYGQFEENLVERKAYRDFLYDILCHHERSLSLESSIATPGGSVDELDSETKTGVEEAMSAPVFPCFIMPTAEFSNLSAPIQSDEDVLPKMSVKLESSGTDSQPYDEKPMSLKESLQAASLLCLGSNAGLDPNLLVQPSCEDSKLGLVDRNPNKGSGGPFACEICKKGFIHNSKLQRHKRIHTGERPYVCKFCNRAFNDRSHMIAHESLHTGLRSHTCTFCSKSFSNASRLRIHERIHTGERPFACSVCDKAFHDKSHLTAHERLHTGERPYMCSVCFKTFTKSAHLRAHEAIHTGERAHVCNLCGKAFKQSSCLRAHRRIHTGERPYVCKVCGRGFKQKSGLLAHEQARGSCDPNVSSSSQP